MFWKYLAVLTVVTVLAQSAFSWRPQGRFGKRTLDSATLNDVFYGNKGGLDVDYSMGDTDEMADSEDSMPNAFRHNNLVCLRRSQTGVYKCIRLHSEQDVRLDLHSA